jgi:ABC-type polysaccharide/polyol phosphate transport system ATPase subunit
MELPSDTAISLINASVRYRKPDEPIGSFKEFSIRLLERRVKMKDFWALKDINLEIKQGETFGIIGRNGAGKTTLLKLVSRVLAPTKGRVILRGNVAPLLELGAGFHPELTGKENVFLNASLLGHSQKEIKQHLDEILDFAEINGIIGAPLRTYSSGMVARLGFSIATTWVPEILILDEILTVGDESFKDKCYSRIERFHTCGSTILIVSHNMNTILTQCDRAVWLDHGQVMEAGKTQAVVNEYLADVKQSNPQPGVI